MMNEVREVVAKMTLEDKIKLCSGAGFWESESMEQYGIPSFFMSDGPHGLRTQKGSQIISESTGVNNQPVSRQRPPVRPHGIPGCCAGWGKQSARRRCTTAWMWS